MCIQNLWDFLLPMVNQTRPKTENTISVFPSQAADVAISQAIFSRLNAQLMSLFFFSFSTIPTF